MSSSHCIFQVTKALLIFQASGWDLTQYKHYINIHHLNVEYMAQMGQIKMIY